MREMLPINDIYSLIARMEAGVTTAKDAELLQRWLSGEIGELLDAEFRMGLEMGRAMRGLGGGKDESEEVTG